MSLTLVLRMPEFASLDRRIAYDRMVRILLDV